MTEQAGLNHLRSYPVTGLTIWAAVLATVWWWTSDGDPRLTMDVWAWHGEPWRLWTSALLHANVMHLAFNLYWLWVFGTVIERVNGHGRLACLMVFLSFVTSAAEYAFSTSGVGLSGVGYGMFGYLWFAGRKDPRLRAALGRGIVGLFLGWFVLCIVFTIAELWRIGNFAHAAGAIFGILIGHAVGSTSKVRIFRWGAVALLTLLVGTTSAVGRPYVNLLGLRGQGPAQLAYRALTRDGDPERAVRQFHRAVDLNPDQAGWWYNLGIAHERTERIQEAIAAYQRAFDLEPTRVQFRNALRDWKAYLGETALSGGDYEGAVKLLEEATRIDSSVGSTWHTLGLAHLGLGDTDEATRAFEKAAELNPPEGSEDMPGDLGLPPDAGGESRPRPPGGPRE